MSMRKKFMRYKDGVVGCIVAMVTRVVGLVV